MRLMEGTQLSKVIINLHTWAAQTPGPFQTQLDDHRLRDQCCTEIQACRLLVN